MKTKAKPVKAEILTVELNIPAFQRQMGEALSDLRAGRIDATTANSICALNREFLNGTKVMMSLLEKTGNLNNKATKKQLLALAKN